MEKQEVIKKAHNEYGLKNVIVATLLTGKCQCEKEVVVLPSNELFCCHCYGYWKEV